MNPLHTPEWVAETVRNSGTYFDQSRRTGRSTAIALQLLGVAIRHPGKPIDIRDHHESESAHRELKRTMQDMCQQLGLEHMQFAQHLNTVTFKRI